MKILDNVGAKIKMARVIRCLSQEYMAEELGISQSTYSRIESGIILPGIDKIALISRVTKTKPEYFYTECKPHSFGAYLE